MKNRPGVENVFSGQRSNDQVLAAGVGLRLEIDPEEVAVIVDEVFVVIAHEIAKN